MSTAKSIRSANRLGIDDKQMSHPELATLADRLRYALNRKRVRQGDLAKTIGVTNQVVSYLCNSNVRRSRFTPYIADALDINLPWLENGEGPFETISEQTSSETRVPILNNGTLPQALYSKDKMAWLIKNADNTVVVKNANAEYCFGYLAEDQAMLPRISQGDVLIIDTSKIPKEGDIVFLHLEDTGEYVCRYYDLSGQTIRFAPINTTSYKTLKSSTSIRIIGVVVEYRWVG